MIIIHPGNKNHEGGNIETIFGPPQANYLEPWPSELLLLPTCLLNFFRAESFSSSGLRYDTGGTHLFDLINLKNACLVLLLVVTIFSDVIEFVSFHSKVS